MFQLIEYSGPRFLIAKCLYVRVHRARLDEGDAGSAEMMAADVVEMNVWIKYLGVTSVE